MQKLAEVCIRRPVFASMIILALVVVGAASYFKLGVDRFPKVDLPTVSVRTDLPGASTEEVETQVSQKIEEVVNTVEGITELRSISGAGKSIIIVTFALSRNIDVAAQDVRDRVATVLAKLPRDVRPPVIAKSDNDSSPVMTIALSGNRSLRELTELADKLVKIQVERSGGVGEVRLVGGLLRAINVWIDADRLNAYQIPISAVRDAIARQNSDLPGGNVTRGGREESLRTLGRMPDSRAFEALVVATVNGVPIRIRDLGRAEDGTKEQRSLARLVGVPTVTREGRRQPASSPSCRRTCGSRSSATSRATSTPRCTRSTSTWCSGRSSPASSCSRSCGAGGRPSSRASRSPPRSSPRSGRCGRSASRSTA
jgi:HAE1 family hydrophobic/amphiphilic exporter-1